MTEMVAVDFLVVPTIRFRMLFICLVMSFSRKTVSSKSEESGADDFLKAEMPLPHPQYPLAATRPCSRVA